MSAGTPAADGNGRGQPERPGGEHDDRAASTPGEVAERLLLTDHRAWDAPGFLLWHATLRWQRHVGAALRPLELTHVQFVLLGSLWWLSTSGPPPSQRELADHAGTDVMMTSQVVRVLERRGLVTREGDPSDGRVRRVSITPEGQRLAERAVAAVDAADLAFFADAGLPEQVLAVLHRLADRDRLGRPVRPQ